jgi:hypothetical protein
MAPHHLGVGVDGRKRQTTINWWAETRGSGSGRRGYGDDDGCGGVNGDDDDEATTTTMAAAS